MAQLYFWAGERFGTTCFHLSKQIVVREQTYAKF